MQPSPRLTLADSLSGIWASLHARAELRISENEVHYLRSIALALDDDIVSCLLLRKLRLAAILPAAEIGAATVTMNSLVEFTQDGGARQRRRLVHPSADQPADALSVGSLLGAGLIGISVDQAILWPNAKSGFGHLRVTRVEDRSAGTARGSSIGGGLQLGL